MPVNILLADTKDINGVAHGQMILQLPEVKETAERMIKDLKAKKIMTVHHSKYALAKHPWNEPLTNEKKMQEQDSLNMMIPEIGEVMPL